MPPKWKTSNKTYIWLFNVGRGLSIFVRLPNNMGLWYDLGCSEEFSPVEFLKENILPNLTKYKKNYNPGQLIISHPHVDHVQEVSNLNEIKGDYDPGLITAPHDKEVEGQEEEKLDFTRIENEDNKEIISKYKKLYETRNPPLQTIKKGDCPEIKDDVVYGLYYMRPPEVEKIYPEDDHKYVNGVSLCFYLRHNRHSIWITGDVTPEVHEEIITGEEQVEKRFTYFGTVPENTIEDFHSKTSSQPTPEALFDKHGLTLLVAPLHGLESCFCQSLFDSIPGGKTRLNIISEKRHVGENDGEVDGRYGDENHSIGEYVITGGAQSLSRMVSTRNGHHMLFILGRNSDRPIVHLSKDPNDLLILR